MTSTGFLSQPIDMIASSIPESEDTSVTTAALDWSNLSSLLLARNDTASKLSDSYKRCFSSSGGCSELILITGPAGVGKTSIAFSLKSQVAEDDGFMIAGKFEQLLESNLQASTTKVYSAFTAAFTEYIENVVEAGETVLQAVKNGLESGMDPTELQVLQEMIPDLDKIIDRQLLTNHHTVERDSILKGADADDRLIEILSRFVRTICCSCLENNKPIVLLFDDVQWANRSSLNFLTNLLVSCREACVPPSLMLVCTCRMNEVPPDHPLTSTLRDMNDQNVVVTEIQVPNLTANEINQVVAGVLHVPSSVSRALSDLLFRQTEGNLLFLVELIKFLDEDKVLVHEAGRWTWNMDKVLVVARRVGSINLLIEKKVLKLDAKEQELLRIASCLGSSFSIAAISFAGVVAVDEIDRALQLLERSTGFICVDSKSGYCHFVHDKVQQTIYQLTPESVIEELHLNIGRQLKKSMPKELLAENVILVSHQISLGVHLIDNTVEKQEVAEMFLQAGQQAALCSSFTTAAAFVNLAIKLLSRRRWKDQYKLSLRLHNFAAELEYYNGNLKRFDELVNAVLKHARCFDDTLVARFTRIYSLGSRGSMQEGLNESLDVLKSLGEDLPRKPGIFQIIVGMLRCKHTLHGKSDAYILNLPAMKDVRKQAAMRLMIYSILFAFYSSGKHVPLIAFRLAENTLRHGMSEMACVGFGCLGMVYAYQGNIDEAYRYSRLSLQLFEEYGAKEWQARIGVVVHGMVFPLKHSIRETLEPLYAAHRSSLVLGDIHFSMLCNIIYANRCYFAGFPLARVMKETMRCRELCIKFGQLSTQSWVELYLQQVLNLMGRSADPLVLTGEITNEDEARRVAQESNPLDYLYLHFTKLQLAIYMNDLPAAKDVLDGLKRLDKKKFLPNMMALLHFYEGLAYAMSPATADRKQSRKSLAKLKVFAKHSPCNYLNKAYLIEAELAGQACKFDDATTSFNLSIELAQKEGLIQDQALACERASYALARGQRLQEANAYLAAARTLYVEWGAQAKVDKLIAL